MIVSCGEALIDFLPAGYDGEIGYVPRPGGSPFNVAIGLARLAVPTGFLGRISTDFFGDLLVNTLSFNGVEDRFVSRGVEPSTLAFVSIKGMGEYPQFAFYHQGAADRMLTPAHLPRDLGPEIEVLHFGSYSLMTEPTGSTLAGLMRREHGKRFISLDPNVRSSMFSDRVAYVRRLEELVGYADLVKVSRRDLAWLYPNLDPLAMAERWLERGPQLVVVTLAEEGAIAFRGSRRIPLPTRAIKAVDVVGAGDSFIAALLAGLRRRKMLTASALAGATEEDLIECLAFANKAAAVACMRPGADMPRLPELLDS